MCGLSFNAEGEESIIFKEQLVGNLVLSEISVQNKIGKLVPIMICQ